MAFTVHKNQVYDVNWGGRVASLSPTTTITCTELPFGNSFCQDALTDITSADFRQVMPVQQIEFDVAEASALRNKNLDSASIQQVSYIHVPVTNTEELVLIEFDPDTGDICGWSRDIESEDSSHRFAKKAGGRTALFAVPLTLSQNPMNYAKRGALDLPDSLIRRGKTLFAIFSLSLEKLINSSLNKIVSAIEKTVKENETLQWFDSNLNLPKVSPEHRAGLRGKKILLFVHGIISSTRGAFDELVKSENCYASLHEKYDGNLLAYDHWTLAKTCLENALDLAHELPAGVRVDIICHSRGAAVVRALIELEGPRNIIDQKQIKIGKVCFVAGACEGSALAQRDTVERLFKIFAVTNKVLSPGSRLPNLFWSYLIKMFLRGLQELPGTDSMDPDSKFIKKDLRATQSTKAEHYYYIRANYEAKGKLLRHADEIFVDQTFFSNGGNDVVVPYDGAGKNDNYLKDKVLKTNLLEFPITPARENSKVWHITFFEDPNVQHYLQKLFGQ